MRPLTVLVAAASLLVTAHAHAQRVVTYTQSQSGADFVALGYPVPQPVASLTPVAGFRDYPSLHARLQSLAVEHDDIAAHRVGQTIAGRDVWAYVVSAPGDSDTEGRAKPAFFINATTHAREWAAPEVATGLVERMADGHDDGGLVRYLLDNSRLVIIPVQNVDGFQQTQRYPSQVVVGADPTSRTTWPRDGRMRRKNMRGADETLTTFADHLAGIDLNRNHPPFWATSLNGSSANPTNLLYHGGGPHTEPENQAMLQAATLGPVSRMRLGVDLHTFSKVFFSSNTGRTRLNAVQTQLLSVLSAHHAAQPVAGRAVHDVRYTDVPDPANRGIGVAAEYFAYQWLVPAWTQELEPSNSSREYGGLGYHHDGFMLPDSEIARVREAWAESFLVGFYYMAGAPHLARVRIFDAGSGALLRERRWQWDPAQQQRVPVEAGSGAITPGQALRVELGFSKPMRHRVNGQIAVLPGAGGALNPGVALVSNGQRRLLSTAEGLWLEDAGMRYRDDSFSFEMEAPESAGEFNLEVTSADMVGLSLDGDPSTPVDWEDGGWDRWEDSNGLTGDQGGTDSTSRFEVSERAPVAIVRMPRFAGEGDAVRIVLERTDAGSGALALAAVELDRVPTFEQLSMSPFPPRAQWADGETGQRSLVVPLPDGPNWDGDEDMSIPLVLLRPGQAPVVLEVAEVSVLDNDRPGLSVLRGRNRLPIADLDESDAADRVVVLDGNRDYVTAPASPILACVDSPVQLRAPIRIYGNGANIVSHGCRPALAAIGPGAVELQGVSTDMGLSDVSLRLQNSTVRIRDEAGNSSIVLVGSRVTREGDAPHSELHAKSSTVVGPLEVAGRDARLDSASVFAASPVLRSAGTGRFLIGGSIVYAHAPSSGPVCQGTAPVSSGFNLISDDSCGMDQTGDIEGAVLADVELGFATRPTGVAIDGGSTSCATVDQLGAPRPQTLEPGAEPRCDIGAIELGINPYRGLWIPDRPGHGIDMQTSGNLLTLLWYTYTDDGQPTAYQAVAPLTGPRWRATLQRIDRDPATLAISETDIGTIGLDFSSNREAALSWRFDARGIEGSEGLRAYLFADGEPRVETTGSWFPPAEPGNGMSIVRRGEVTGALLYYYDAAGTLRWMLGTGDAADVVDIEMLSFTGFCPDCDATAMPSVPSPAGNLRVHFLTPRRARVDSDVTYPGPAGGHWQRSNADFVPINDPVDNRHTLP